MYLNYHVFPLYLLLCRELGGCLLYISTYFGDKHSSLFLGWSPFFRCTGKFS